MGGAARCTVLEGRARQHPSSGDTRCHGKWTKWASLDKGGGEASRNHNTRSYVFHVFEVPGPLSVPSLQQPAGWDGFVCGSFYPCGSWKARIREGDQE